MNSQPGAPRPRPGYRIGVVLAMIAVVPLLGAAWFAVREVVAADLERERIEEIDRTVEELVALSQLRARLLEEENWGEAESGLDQIGLSPQLVVIMTGIDVPSAAAAAATRVDGLIDELGLEDVRAELERARAIGADYDAVESLVATRTAQGLDRVVSTAGQVTDEGELIESLQVLDAATVASQAMSVEINEYFGAVFSLFEERDDEVVSLVGQGALRVQAFERIDRHAAPGSAAMGAVEAIRDSVDAEAFETAKASLITARITGAAEHGGIEDAMADLAGVAAVFESAAATTDLHLELVEAAGVDASAASADAGAAAARRDRRALLALGVLAAISVGVAVAATSVIVRPLHRLAAAARSIRDGDVGEDLVVVSGPNEVREAARALNEAGSHLSLAERQALALAEGDLEHDSLVERGSGALGASLQDAVQTLAASLQEREEFRRRVTHEATHDGLTQLPNRNASLAQLTRGVARTSRSQSCLAVLFVDLDGFKDVNDRHGHHAGDVVLRATAKRLSAAVREGDHVGRLGGDEFVVIAEPVRDANEAADLADRIRRAVREPIAVDTTTVSVGASIGIALSSPSTGGASDLLRDADLAVYRAKELGRDRIEVCGEELRAAMVERADLERALREAVERDEFVLHYQQIVEPRAGGIVGLEALVRWDRPGHGLLYPDGFIPFAERSDLIVHVDRWVLRAVARQITEWDAAGRFVDVPVSVNVSGRHLTSGEFIANVTGPLDEYGVDPARIVVEVTEGALLDDLGTAAAKLQLLRKRGIRTAIDDFGTGYTSLAHLKSLPVDILKIDRSFTGDESAASLVKLIIDTGHLLGATVTAEGIETTDQAASLGALGSDDLQGFLYGRPVPPSELTEDRVVQRSSDKRSSSFS